MTALEVHGLNAPRVFRRTNGGKYVGIALLSARQRLEERAALYGRIIFYFIILLIFARLWEAVLGSPGPPAPTQGPTSAASYVWYLAITEWIMLSQPSLYLDIETDVRSGDVAYQLTRPISYAGAKLADAFGDMALRWLVLGASGILFARLLSGQWPSGMGLVLAALVGCLASIVLLLSYAAIGLSAFWIHDCTSVFLIWQKLCFALGGLMVPLSIYPEWLRQIALHSPFAALLYGPGQLVMEPDAALAWSWSASLLGWGALFLFVVLLLERQGRKALTLHGG
jgi:viologen exporter family transport system permease protein